MKSVLLILFLFQISTTQGFVHQKTLSGKSFIWKKGQEISLYVNPSNSSGISDSNILSRVSESISQWNSTGAPGLNQFSTTAASLSGRNDIYFSNDPIFFSSTSVLAVTESTFNDSTGNIIEADIIIKDSVLFSNSKTSSPYIGDIFSHEIGHLLGLDHSSLAFSTMFYKLVRGQNSISYDDQLAADTLYSYQRATGVISGKVGGGDSAIGIFGADVQLISSTEGRIVASVATEPDGSFSFSGINLNDVYYIFVKPLKNLSSISPYYQTIKSDFCTSFSSFRGGFYEACDSSRRGYPHGISLSSSNTQVDLGIITIKCNLNVPLNYFQARETGNFDPHNGKEVSGDSFIGFFTESDISNAVEDIITIDLSHVDASAGNKNLDLRLLSQDFQSRVVYDVEVSSPAGIYNFNYSIDSDTNPNLNIIGRIPLDPSSSSNNVFTVTVKPKDFGDFLPFTSFPLESMFFPDFSNIGDSRFFYQFIYFVSESSGPLYSVNSHYDYARPRSNLNCMEAQKTYSVKPSGAVTGVTSKGLGKKKSDSSALACGTIDIDNDGSGGGGPFTVILGFIFTVCFINIRRNENLNFWCSK